MVNYFTRFEDVHDETLRRIRDQGFIEGYEFFAKHKSHYDRLRRNPNRRLSLIMSLVEIIAEGEKLYANQGVGVLPKNTGLALKNEPEVYEHVIGVLHSIAELHEHPERIHRISDLAA